MVASWPSARSAGSRAISASCKSAPILGPRASSTRSRSVIPACHGNGPGFCTIPDTATYRPAVSGGTSSTTTESPSTSAIGGITTAVSGNPPAGTTGTSTTARAGAPGRRSAGGRNRNTAIRRSAACGLNPPAARSRSGSVSVPFIS